jgi:hypothetical protein
VQASFPTTYAAMNPKPAKAKSAQAKKTQRVYLSKGLSIHPKIYEEAVERSDALGLSFSQYVAQCLRRDLQAGGDFTVRKASKAEPRAPSHSDKW